MSCFYLATCKFICSKAKQAQEENKLARAEAQANDEAKRREQSDKILAEAEIFWRRVNDLCQAAGVDLQEAAAPLLPYRYQAPSIKKIVNGDFDKMIYSYSDVGLDAVRKVVEVCGLLGCSADALLGLPSSSGQSREKAEWIQSATEMDKWDCSNCGNYEFADDYPADEGFLYCSRCGRYMGKEGLHESD